MNEHFDTSFCFLGFGFWFVPRTYPRGHTVEGRIHPNCCISYCVPSNSFLRKRISVAAECPGSARPAACQARATVLSGASLGLLYVRPAVVHVASALCPSTHSLMSPGHENISGLVRQAGFARSYPRAVRAVACGEGFSRARLRRSKVVFDSPQPSELCAATQ